MYVFFLRTAKTVIMLSKINDRSTKVLYQTAHGEPVYSLAMGIYFSIKLAKR